MSSVLVFTASWCAPSKQYKKRLAKGYFKFDYTVHDIEQEPKFADKHDVAAIPMTVILNDDGVEVKRLYGFKPDEETIDKIKAIVGE
jgi:thioredoxin-like negative regulator of GroEL